MDRSREMKLRIEIANESGRLFDSLLVPLHRSQNRSTVDIKHLNNSLISTSNYQFPILPDFHASRCLLESSDGLDDLSRSRCVYM